MKLVDDSILKDKMTLTPNEPRAKIPLSAFDFPTHPLKEDRRSKKFRFAISVKMAQLYK